MTTLHGDAIDDIRELRLTSFEPTIARDASDDAAVRTRFRMLYATDEPARVRGNDQTVQVANALGEILAAKTPARLEGASRDLSSYQGESRRLRQVSAFEGIPRLWGVGSAAGRPVLVCEWVDGVTVRDVADKLRHQAPSAIAALARDVMAVLARVAELDRPLAHGSIDADAVLIRTDRRTLQRQCDERSFDVCLLDFGAVSSGATPAGDVAATNALVRELALSNGEKGLLDTLDLSGNGPACGKALAHMLRRGLAGKRKKDASASTAADWRDAYAAIADERPGDLAVRTVSRRRFAVAAGIGAVAALAVGSGVVAWLASRPRGSSLEPLRSAAWDGSTGLLWVQDADTGLWGLLDTESHWAVKPAFEDAGNEEHCFSEGLMAACADPDSDEGYGYVDGYGAWAIDPQFSLAGDFHDGLAVCCTMAKSGDILYHAHGYIDTSGDWVIEPGFLEAADFSEGLAACCNVETKLYGYVDGSGAWAIEPTFVDAGAFSEGLAACASDAGLYGYIDKTGQMVISPRFSWAHAFSEDLAVCAEDVEKGYGYVNSAGAWVIEPRFVFASEFSQGLARCAEGSRAGDSFGPSGYVNSRGAWVIEPRFARAADFSEGLAACAEDLDGLVGYIDTAGEWAIEPRFEEACDFANGLAAVKDPRTSLWGFVDANGDWAAGDGPRFANVGWPADRRTLM